MSCSAAMPRADAVGVAAGGFVAGLTASALILWLRRHQPSHLTHTEEIGLHGRAKHDMTPAQLAARQNEDPLVALLMELLKTSSIADACARAEALIADHFESVGRPRNARLSMTRRLSRTISNLNEDSLRRLRRKVSEATDDEGDQSSKLSIIAPRLTSASEGRLWQPLPLTDAFRDYDSESHISARTLVAPTFRELRNICNLAQARAAVQAGIKLLTFDGDKTLYPDRGGLSRDSPLVPYLYRLLQNGVNLALVTAVGFDHPEPYEERLNGLLHALREGGDAERLGARLFVVGGQCNYLARCVGADARLVMVPKEEWQLPEMCSWDEVSVVKLLNVAQNALLEGVKRMGIRTEDVKLVRKERAVGILYLPDVHRTTSLMLDEIALGARQALTALKKQKAGLLYDLPFCTFNGGRDVFVDVGSKDLGITALQRLVGAVPQDTLHIGDQFTLTGNDLLARRACGTLWVDTPDETAVLLSYILRRLGDDEPQYAY